MKANSHKPGLNQGHSIWHYTTKQKITIQRIGNATN